MSTLELVRALYDYNEWANNYVLDAAGKLTALELERPFPASFGSVEANLAHVLAGQVVWPAALDGWVELEAAGGGTGCPWSGRDPGGVPRVAREAAAIPGCDQGN